MTTYKELDASYKPGKILGRGSFGCARLVTCRKTSRTMVAKEIKLDNLSRTEREKAQSEADLLRVCSSHPNICTYVESFLSSLEGEPSAGCSLHIVMDHCDGGDLGQLVDGKKKLGRAFSENEAMAIFVQLNLALEHVHAQRILHRDIKAQNIFLTKQGVVKLGDFGIAKALGQDSIAQTRIGTPYYLAPEICRGESYSRPADVWSLGVVMYLMLQLRLPFEADSMAALVRRIVDTRQGPAALPQRYSAELRTLVGQMLQQDASRRPSAAAMTQSALLQGHVKRLQSLVAGAAGAARRDRRAHGSAKIREARAQRRSERDSEVRRRAMQQREQGWQNIVEEEGKEVDDDKARAAEAARPRMAASKPSSASAGKRPGVSQLKHAAASRRTAAALATDADGEQPQQQEALNPFSRKAVEQGRDWATSQQLKQPQPTPTPTPQPTVPPQQQRGQRGQYEEMRAEMQRGPSGASGGGRGGSVSARHAAARDAAREEYFANRAAALRNKKEACLFQSDGDRRGPGQKAAPSGAPMWWDGGQQLDATAAASATPIVLARQRKAAAKEAEAEQRRQELRAAALEARAAQQEVMMAARARQAADAAAAAAAAAGAAAESKDDEGDESVRAEEKEAVGTACITREDELAAERKRAYEERKALERRYANAAERNAGGSSTWQLEGELQWQKEEELAETAALEVDTELDIDKVGSSDDAEDAIGELDDIVEAGEGGVGELETLAGTLEMAIAAESKDADADDDGDDIEDKYA